MQLNDACGLIERVMQLVYEDGEKEHCAIGCAKIEECDIPSFTVLDYCMVEELGGVTAVASVKIPIKLSIALLRICGKNGYVPLILHTHRVNADKAVSFSEQDLKFIESFSDYAVKHESVPVNLFLVMNRVSLMCCVYDEKLPNLLLGEVQYNAENRARGLYHFT